MTETVVLLVYCLLREGLFWYSHQKLLNKFMSKDFDAYKYAESAYRPVKETKLPVPQDIPEDLRILQEFQGHALP